MIAAAQTHVKAFIVPELKKNRGIWEATLGGASGAVMDGQSNFKRIGEVPGTRPMLTPVCWLPGRRPLSDGMMPSGREYYRDEAGQLSSGLWQCDAGAVEIEDNPNERLYFIVHGVLRLTDAAGLSESFGAGECVAIPKGFTGLWSHSDKFAAYYIALRDADCGDS